MRRKEGISGYFGNFSAIWWEESREEITHENIFLAEIGNFETFISEITITEIERSPDVELRNKMKDAVSRFSVLSLTDDVEWIASEYIRYGAVPEGYLEDAYHIAIAVINEMDLAPSVTRPIIHNSKLIFCIFLHILFSNFKSTP